MARRKQKLPLLPSSPNCGSRNKDTRRPSRTEEHTPSHQATSTHVKRKEEQSIQKQRRSFLFPQHSRAGSQRGVEDEHNPQLAFDPSHESFVCRERPDWSAEHGVPDRLARKKTMLGNNPDLVRAGTARALCHDVGGPSFVFPSGIVTSTARKKTMTNGPSRCEPVTWLISVRM